jgi:ubiquinone/menaquinone biosynthesis C-methylase UbiE
LSSVRSKVEIGGWVARYYDILLNVLSVGRYSHFVKEVIEKMDIEPGQSILDLGSGTGRNDCLMAQKIGPQGKIAGLDISDEMISRALKRCHEYPNVSFEQQRIELPLAYKEEFDKVFISFTLHGFEDDQKVGIISNAYQALKPGGTFHVLDYAEFEPWDYSPIPQQPRELVPNLPLSFIGDGFSRKIMSSRLAVQNLRFDLEASDDGSNYLCAGG